MYAFCRLGDLCVRDVFCPKTSTRSGAALSLTRANTISVSLRSLLFSIALFRPFAPSLSHALAFALSLSRSLFPSHSLPLSLFLFTFSHWHIHKHVHNCEEYCRFSCF